MDAIDGVLGDLGRPRLSDALRGNSTFLCLSVCVCINFCLFSEFMRNISFKQKAVRLREEYCLAAPVAELMKMVQLRANRMPVNPRRLPLRPMGVRLLEAFDYDGFPIVVMGEVISLATLVRNHPLFGRFTDLGTLVVCKRQQVDPATGVTGDAIDEADEQVDGQQIVGEADAQAASDRDDVDRLDFSLAAALRLVNNPNLLPRNTFVATGDLKLIGLAVNCGCETIYVSPERGWTRFAPNPPQQGGAGAGAE